MNEYKKTDSRKWKLILLVIAITTLGTFIPPILSAWVFHDSEVLFILTGTSFVTLISLILSAYLGANVWQKKVLKEEKDKTKITTNEIKTITNEVSANENGEA